MIVIVGGTGRLGRAIARGYMDETILIPTRAVYENWSNANAQADIERFLIHAKTYAGDRSLTVFVASGVLNSRAAESEHDAVNYQLPKNILSAAGPLGIAVVTCGTIMETFNGADNAYIRSKRALNELVQSGADAGASFSHVQIHTLYGGGLPSPFMFLGQMLESLNHGQAFEMSDGRQFREYHHVDDDVRAIKQALSMGKIGVLPISHGKPVRLRDLAITIFDALGRRKDLKVGELQRAQGENVAYIYDVPDYCQAVEFRDTSTAVPAYMKISQLEHSSVEVSHA